MTNVSKSESDQIPAPSMLVLRDDHIIETIAKLQNRISERFPSSGLADLCGQLLGVSRQASRRSDWIRKPIIWIRVVGYTLAIGVVLLILLTISMIPWETEGLSLLDFVQTFEAGINEVILIGAAIYFLISLEVRIKRRRALAAVHELRSIAHIIDMHQLTKDPERILRTWQGAKTSPTVRMTPLLLNRYLDYCSEMLSLTGKIAALYVRNFDDAVCVAAVSEVEQLTTGLSRKIWQKIMILNQVVDKTISSQGDTRPTAPDQNPTFVQTPTGDNHEHTSPGSANDEHDH